MGVVEHGRVKAFIASGRNSWRPILRARIDPDQGAGSVVSGTIGSAAWVNVFSFLWLVVAVTLTGTLVIGSLIGLITGTSLMRGGGGEPQSPVTAVVISVGALVIFGGAGVGMPLVSRRMTARDPDRLIAFVAAAVDGAEATEA